MKGSSIKLSGMLFAMLSCAGLWVPWVVAPTSAAPRRLTVETIDDPGEGTTAAARTAALRSLTVAATGDILAENAILDAGRAGASAAGKGARYDFAPLLEEVRPIIASAQLAICHIETPIGAPGVRPGAYGRSPYGGNLLLAPYEIAGDLADAGYDRCSTASNHSNDLGPAGIDSTLSALDAVGIGHVGTARNATAAKNDVITVNGVRVAHLGYTRYSNTSPTSNPWSLNFAHNAQEVIDDVTDVRAAGAEVVIVSVHLSQELLRSPTAVDRQFVTEIAAAADVDLVIQHGPHVVQPVEQVNGTLVYWSVGNFMSGMGQPGATRYGPPTLDGLLAWVTFTEGPPGRFVAVPTTVLVCNEIAGRVVYPAVSTLEDPSIGPALREQLQACVDRTRSLVPDVQ